MKNKKPQLISRILLRPEWRLHLAHIGTIYYQSARCDLLYLLIDDRSPHLSKSLIRDFILDIEWLGLPNIKIVRITDFYLQLLHCAYWFIDLGETHLEKIIVRNLTCSNTNVITTKNSYQKPNTYHNNSNYNNNYHHDSNLRIDNADFRGQRDPDRKIKKYYLREMEIPKVKRYFNLTTLTAPRDSCIIKTVEGLRICGCCGSLIKLKKKKTPGVGNNEDEDPDDDNEDDEDDADTDDGAIVADAAGEEDPDENDYTVSETDLLKQSLNEMAETSKLRVRTNDSPSTIIMNYYLDEKVADINLSFALPVIDCLLGVTLIMEQSLPQISEETHNFNRRIFQLLGNQYPNYERHPSYKLIRYRYHSNIIIDLIKKKELDGYDDSRLMTIRNLRIRGYPPKLIQEFARLGALKGSIDPQQLPDICKALFQESKLPKFNGILEPVRIVLENFPVYLTRYFTGPFCKETLALRKIFWIDQAELKNNFTLKSTNTCVQLKQRIPLNADGQNIWKQDYHNTYWKAELLSHSQFETFPPTTSWLSCDPMESPFQVKFIYYPEYFTGFDVPKEIKIIDGLLNTQPEQEGIIIIQNYGFFYYDGEDGLHLLCPFPKGKSYQASQQLTPTNSITHPTL